MKGRQGSCDKSPLPFTFRLRKNLSAIPFKQVRRNLVVVVAIFLLLLLLLLKEYIIDKTAMVVSAKAKEERSIKTLNT
jgi:hypothetical protein